MDALLFRPNPPPPEKEESEYLVDEETFVKFEPVVDEIRQEKRPRDIPDPMAQANLKAVLAEIHQVVTENPDHRVRHEFGNVMAEIRDKPTPADVSEEVQHSSSFTNSATKNSSPRVVQEIDESHTEEEPMEWEEHDVDSKPTPVDHSFSSTEESETGWPSEDESSSDEIEERRSAALSAKEAIFVDQENGFIEPVTVAFAQFSPIEPNFTEPVGLDPLETDRAPVETSEPENPPKRKKAIARLRQIFAFGRLRSSKRTQASEEVSGPCVLPEINPHGGDGSSSGEPSSSHESNSDSSSDSDSSSVSDAENVGKLSVIPEDSEEFRPSSKSSDEASGAAAHLELTYEKAPEETERTSTDVTHSHSSADDPEIITATGGSGVENRASVTSGNSSSQGTGDSQYTLDPVYGPILREEQNQSELSLLTVHSAEDEASTLLAKNQGISPSDAVDENEQISGSEPRGHGFLQGIKGLFTSTTIKKKSGNSNSSGDIEQAHERIDQSFEGSFEKFDDEDDAGERKALLIPADVGQGHLDDEEMEREEKDLESENEEFRDEELGAADGHFARAGNVPGFPTEATEPLVPTEIYKIHEGEGDLISAEYPMGFQSDELEQRSGDGVRTGSPRTGRNISRCACVLFLFVIVMIVVLPSTLVRKNRRDPNRSIVTMSPTTSPTSSPIVTDNIFERPTDTPTSSPSSAPSSFPSDFPSIFPSTSPSVAPVPFPVIQNISADDLWAVDFSSAAEDNPVSLYAAHLESNVTLRVMLPDFNNSTFMEVLTIEEEFVEIGSQCSELMNATTLMRMGNNTVQGNDTYVSVFVDGIETAVVFCVDDSIVGASFHIFPPDALVNEELYFTITVDFTDNTLESDRAVQRGPGVGLDGAALMLLLGDDNTTFFDLPTWFKFLPTAPPSFRPGDPCPKIYNGVYPTAFPVTPLLFEDPSDNIIFACNGTIIGRLFLYYVPMDDGGNKTLDVGNDVNVTLDGSDN
eukprot:scaffold37094_cov122-Amphora_coffeaeformis.AAC.1